MVKKIIATSIAATALLLSGCGEDSTTCRIDVQRNIDKGNFAKAIDQLNGECATAFSPSDRYMNLASAYMGESGFGVSDVVQILSKSNDSNDSNTFNSFTRSVSENRNDESLALLTQAKDYFLLAINPDANVSTLSTTVCDGNLTQATPRVANACLYVGFNQTLTTTTTVTYLTQDVDTFVEALDDDTNTTQVPLDMKASLDALAWAVDTNDTLPNNSLITPQDVNISGAQYTHLIVNTPDDNNVSHTFYRLAKSSVRDANNSTIVTSGYCDKDGNKTVCETAVVEDSTTHEVLSDSSAGTCYACPVNLGTGNDQSVADLLVDTLNGGTDVVANLTGDEDIKDSVDDFVRDVKGLPEGADVSDVNVTIDDILKYLNKQ